MALLESESRLSLDSFTWKNMAKLNKIDTYYKLTFSISKPNYIEFFDIFHFF